MNSLVHYLKRLRLLPKKVFLLGAGVFLLTVAVGLYTQYKQPHARPPTILRSDKHLITLQPLQKSLLHKRTELVGTYHVKNDQSLFYSIANGTQLVAAGSILPQKNGVFSRNVEFMQPVKPDTPLVLKLYAQNKKGAIIDQLNVKTMYKE